MHQLEKQQSKQSSSLATRILCKGKFNGNSQKPRGMRATDTRESKGEKGNTVSGGGNRGQRAENATKGE